jgi:NAD(P)-dependent dehydrogenase (short-subunit alcohol dehydrogenase family)
VIVTGASTGIGAATAELFGRKGWVVVLAARSQDKIGQDLAKFGALLAGLGALLSVGLGWLITRRRGNQNRRGQ